MKKIMCMGAAVVFALAACGGDDDGGSANAPSGDGGADVSEDAGDAITTTDALAAALVAAGIPCANLEDEALEDDDSFGPESRSGAALCDSDSGQLTLEVFEDEAHLKQFQRQGEAVGCAFLESFGITEVNYAHGEWWSISPEDTLARDTAEQIADALNGEAERLTCDG